VFIPVLYVSISTGLSITSVGKVGDRSDIDIPGLLSDSDMGYIEAIWRASEVCVDVEKAT
jgi:hypothetical protein